VLALHAPASHCSDKDKDHLAANLGASPSTAAQQDTSSTLSSTISWSSATPAAPVSLSQPPPVQGVALQDCALLLLTEPDTELGSPLPVHQQDRQATSSATGKSTGQGGNTAPGKAAGITLLGALVQALGGERVPHLAAVHAGWEAGGRQHLEQVRSALTPSPSYQHYPAYLQRVVQEVQALNREVVARYMKGGTRGQG
jgi:hypothetical protein